MSNFSNERLGGTPGEFGDTYIVSPDSYEGAEQALVSDQAGSSVIPEPPYAGEGVGAPSGQVSRQRPYIVFDTAREPMMQLGGDLEPYRKWEGWFSKASAQSSPEAVWEALDQLLPSYWGNMYRNSQYAASNDFDGFFASLFEQQDSSSK